MSASGCPLCFLASSCSLLFSK